MLVIGGGVVGAGCALDAVTRGLTVGLVEARDFAAGTSSRSSKLSTAACATSSSSTSAWCSRRCKERALLLNALCPHLARPVPFLYPLEQPGHRPRLRRLGHRRLRRAGRRPRRARATCGT